MKSSGIGGQAVMVGVMMKNKQKYAVSVRKPDGEIATDVQEFISITEKHKWMNVPILRGVFNFVESMYIGVKTLTYSAEFFEDEESEKSAAKAAKPAENRSASKKGKKNKGGKSKGKKQEVKAEKAEVKKEAVKEKTSSEKGKDALIMAGTVAFSIVLSIAIFMVIPYFVSSLLTRSIDSPVVLSLVEGLFRLALFIGYVAAISLMSDIKRVFMYHGAEHKSINCIEAGLPLTVENVRKSSRQHKRCGTSFMLIVMVISIFFFCLIRVESAWLRLVVRLLLIPVIAGVSYEFIKLAGRSESKLVNILSKPGLWLQGLTTREPDDDMIEVAIASVEAVFDWRAFIEADFADGGNCFDCSTDTSESLTETAESQAEAEESKGAEKAERAENAERAEKTPSEKHQKTIEEELDVVLKRPARSTEEKVEGALTEEVFGHNEAISDRRGLTKWPGAPKPDDEEDDEVLKALDQFFSRK